MIQKIFASNSLLPIHPPELVKKKDKTKASEQTLKILNPKFNFHQVKAIIFDIDGTLYSLAQSPFVKRYMELVKNLLTPEAYSAFQTAWKKTLEGKSPFRSGRVWDETQKKILVLNRQGKVIKAFEPWGGEIPQKEIFSLYPNPILRGSPKYIFMEGGTWVLTGLARSFGVDFEENEKIYQKIYSEILQNPKKYFEENKELANFFDELKKRGKKIIVMSNTPEPMASTILKALGVWKNVDLFLSGAKKPVQSAEKLQTILQNFGLKPHEVLSVGDSVTNDLEPPHQMGMQTVLIEDFPVDTEEGVDAKGKEIANLIHSYAHVWTQKAA